eukprot:8335753-Alexandrium_andersonii.AAC.1
MARSILLLAIFQLRFPDLEGTSCAQRYPSLHHVLGRFASPAPLSPERENSGGVETCRGQRSWA